MPFTPGHALLIGVSSHLYHPFLDVPIAAHDAQALSVVLRDPDRCGYLPGQVRLLTGADATRAQILAALDNLAQLSIGDTVFLFFVGHGTSGLDGNYYLLPHDVTLVGNRVRPDTGISEADLLEKLRAIPAKRLIMFFNACHAGYIEHSSLAHEDEMEAFVGANPSGKTAHALLGSGTGRILIVASRATQRSYVDRQAKNSIFTKALIDALRGEAPNNGGTISAFGLYEYLYEEVKEMAQATHNVMQKPLLTAIQATGSFPVALYKGTPSLRPLTDDSHVLDQTAPELISAHKSARAFRSVINTSGGAFISGSVNTGGGDFIGRDQIIQGDTIQGDQVAGDKVGGDKITATEGSTVIGERGVYVGGDVAGDVVVNPAPEPESADIHFDQALALIKQYEYHEAHRLCLEALARDSAHGGCHLLAAVALLAGRGADKLRQPTVSKMRVHLDRASRVPDTAAAAWLLLGVIGIDYYRIKMNSAIDAPSLPEILAAQSRYPLPADMDWLNEHLIMSPEASRKLRR